MKKERKKRKEMLIAEISKLEQMHKTQTGSGRTTLQLLISRRDELRDLMEEETNQIMNRHLRDKLRWGNKVGKHLAKILQRKRDKNFIDKIQNKKGDLRFSSKEIGEEFRQYFASLYSVDTKGCRRGKKERVEAFLKEAGINKLTKEDIKDLDNPIMEEEIRSALRSSPSGKSPGPDGFTACFFKTFGNSLVPRLCKLWNELGTQGELSEGDLLAAVTLIPKEGKDRTLCSSYRPIAHINADIKVYAKVLATRFKEKMAHLIHPDQVGFVSGRESRDNGVRSLLITEAIKSSGTPGLFLSIDAEKAFDRVDWVLEKK